MLEIILQLERIPVKLQILESNSQRAQVNAAILNSWNESL